MHKHRVGLILIVIIGVSSILSAPGVADVSLTVYNRDLAVVKQTECFSLISGIQTTTFTGVADRIDPTSVRLGDGGGVLTVLEQNYRYDLVSPSKILQRYIDREVRLILIEGEVASGTLQSVGGDVVLKDRDGGISIVRMDAIERYELPELPDGLITRPTLVWTVNADRAGDVDTEITYMTGGLSWHAEYTAVVAEDERTMETSAWVSVENESGATFEDAALKLVAGDVHRVSQTRPGMMQRQMVKAAMLEDTVAGFTERGLFEYHLYDLGRRTTLANAEIKQISLFDPTVVRAEKQFVFDWRKDPDTVTVSMVFNNSEQDGMGMPLPEGTVRVFTRDTDGELEFVGEDSIDHTPKNEEVRLTLGGAFDITAERRVVENRRISQRVREQVLELELHNRKEEPVTVTAIDHLWGDWQILDSTHEYIKKNATTIEIPVSIPADGEVTVTYTVRLR
jgi:hypothetical protein